MVKEDGLPLGLGFGLAMNEDAMRGFSSLDDDERFQLFPIPLVAIDDSRNYFAFGIQELKRNTHRREEEEREGNKGEESLTQEKKRFQSLKAATFNNTEIKIKPQNLEKEDDFKTKFKAGKAKGGPYLGLVGVHLVASRHRETAPGRRMARTRRRRNRSERATRSGESSLFSP